MVHDVKILPKWFEEALHENKNFEVRRFDRPYKVGDILILREWDRGQYTGRVIERVIEYVYKGDGSYGLSSDFCILGLKSGSD